MQLVRRMGGKQQARDLPAGITWEMTFACPLRCVHCYTESGRRPSETPAPPRLMELTRAIIAMQPKALYLAGGEPLIVKGLLPAIQELHAAKIPMYLFTSGYSLDAAKVAELAPLMHSFHLSVDACTAELHDRIRGKPGSFQWAMDALAALNEASIARRQQKKPPLQFGVDSTIIQSNFHQIDEQIEFFAARFPEIGFMNIGAAVPGGLASTPSFAESELLTEPQLDALRSHPKVSFQFPVSFSDQKYLQMHPDDVAAGTANMDTIEMEPDGSVRAMSMYEGTVGNILVDPPEQIWQRVKERWQDPFVVEQLRTGGRTRVGWAAAVRAIDAKFGNQQAQERIAKRLTVLTAPPSRTVSTH